MSISHSSGAVTPLKQWSCQDLAIAILDIDESTSDIPVLLQRQHCTLHLLRSYAACLSLLANDAPEILIIVLKPGGKDRSPEQTGLAALRELREVIQQAVSMRISVWVLGDEEDEFVRVGLSLGVRGHLSYPLNRQTLLNALELQPDLEKIEKENTSSEANSRDQLLRSLLLSNAPSMQHVYRQIQKAAPTQAAVLITGESGTGKDMAAQAIHRLSQRAHGPFLAVNCGAISPHLIESELFGHEKGSFTGAIRDHRGYFERAHGGTLFLDEITEMPLEQQTNLLRVLETQHFSRLGSTREQRCDIRLITACNRDPRQAVESGYLREDLLYRIQVFPIHMPPLRCRQGDVELLTRHFLESHNRSGGREKRFSPQALSALARYPWPGNVRELKNIVYRAYLMADSTIDLADLPPHFTSPYPSFKGDALTLHVGSTLAEMEEKLINATLRHCRGNRERAAKMLGVSTKTLYNRLRSYRQREPDQLSSSRDPASAKDQTWQDIAED